MGREDVIDRLTPRSRMDADIAEDDELGFEVLRLAVEAAEKHFVSVAGRMSEAVLRQKSQGADFPQK